MENETGDGISTTFRVFPGIYLLHSDFHMQECPTVKSDDADILWLDFCREGRVEWEISKDKYVYLESGNYVMIFGRDVNLPSTFQWDITTELACVFT